MRTRGESLKVAKEERRILRMKNKPTKRATTFEDRPSFKKGPNWRTLNSSHRVKTAIKRNQQFNK